MSRSTPAVTWLGHATFFLETPGGEQLLVDPWLADNPSCPEEYQEVEPDGILLTHGHSDHVANLEAAAARSNGPIVAIFELGEWVKSTGVAEERVVQMNKGGTTRLEGLGVEVTMTDARHSSAVVEEDGVRYAGEPAGYVVHFSDDLSLYIAGDTCLFPGMELIARLHDPDAAVLPIGDHFTMDPEAAALACELLEIDTVVPCHWGTFPLLTGTPEQLEEELDRRGVETDVASLEPGERWRR
ncbi:MAG: metal-dependent hydrolase [Bradymonadaceae bacterium]